MEMKQIMKRLGIMLLTLCLLVGMVGCGSSGSSSDANRQDAEKIKEALRTLFQNDTSSARPDGSMEGYKAY